MGLGNKNGLEERTTRLGKDVGESRMGLGKVE